MSPAWSDAAVDQPVTLGRWSFVIRDAEIADIAHDGTPVLRAVRFVTRDRDWRTADDTVLAAVVHPDGGGVRIEASSAYDGVEVLRYRLDLGLVDEALRVTGDATLTSAFLRNRIGLVVLHPVTLAGAPLEITHTDGSSTTTTYPAWISPHQPATVVAGYAWPIEDGQVSLSLTGDVFEMEDQRNWTDASFKTYSTALSEPFPVALAAGDTIAQSVTISATTPGRVLVGEPGLPGGGVPAGAPAPVLQVLASSAPAGLRPAAAGPAPAAVLVEPELDQPNWRAVLESARLDAAGAPLDVRFVTDDADALRAAVDHVLAQGSVVRIGAFDPVRHITTTPLQAALRDAARAHDGLDLVAGARTHFTELNRTIREFDDWDGALTFSVTPQMHDRSRAQVDESIRMQREVVLSASRLAAGRDLHVGPVTLRPRLNAVATSGRRREAPDLTDGYGPQFVPDSTDPQGRSAAAQAWFERSVEALSVPGVRSITLAEAWGPRSR
jgi:D-apionolactonase